MAHRRARSLSLLGIALLGLLREGPRTGYALRRQFAETPIGHYSSSPGSIYPALRLLQADGLIAYRAAKGERPAFALSPRGVAVLRAWLRTPPDLSDFDRAQDAFMLQLAFLGAENDRALVRRLLQAYEKAAAARLAQLLAFAHAMPPAALPLTARLSMDFGVRSTRAALSWARASLLTISGQRVARTADL